VVASEETVAISIVRKLQEVVDQQPDPDAYLVRVNPGWPPSCSRRIRD